MFHDLTWRQGGVGGLTLEGPVLPSALADMSLRAIKKGVKGPQLYHTVTSAGQVRDLILWSMLLVHG